MGAARRGTDPARFELATSGLEGQRSIQAVPRVHAVARGRRLILFLAEVVGQQVDGVGDHDDGDPDEDATPQEAVEVRVEGGFVGLRLIVGLAAAGDEGGYRHDAEHPPSHAYAAAAVLHGACHGGRTRLQHARRSRPS